MSAVKSKVRLPVSWDVAANAIESVVEDESHDLEVIQRDNGYLEVRGPRGVTMYVHIRVEGPQSTVVSVVAKQSRRLLPVGRASHIDRVINNFLVDVRHHATDSRRYAFQPDHALSM
jgi:hypothetical protein